MCQKGKLNHFPALPVSKAGSNDNINFSALQPSGHIFVADTPTLILTARPCYLLMFPDSITGRDTEEHVVFTVLIPDS